MRAGKTAWAFAFASLALASAPSAFAHAAPVRYEPKSSAVLSAAPSEVSIRFSERIEPGASSITVYAPDGMTIDDGKPAVAPSDARIFSTGIRGAGSGTYTVSWQVVSADDGHFTKGGYIFSVGKPGGTGIASAAGQFQVQHRSDWPEAILIWLELLGEAILLGSLLLTVFLWRPLKQQGITDATDAFFRRRLRVVIMVAGLLLLTGGMGYLLLESFSLAADRSVLPWEAFHFFFTTIAGRFTLYRLIAGVILAAGLWSSASAVKRTPLFFALIILIVLLRARVSHAAASPFLPVFSVLVNAVHLFFKDLWIGGLVVFVTACVPAIRRQGDTTVTMQSLVRFSQMLTLSLAIGGISGVYIVWLHLKSFANVYTTHWGGYFLAVSAYAMVLLFLRLYQQLAVHPSLLRAAEGKATKEDQVQGGSAGVLLLLEMFVGLAVLLFSGILIITTPPLSAQHFYEQTVPTDRATITFGEHHFEDDQFLLTVQRRQPASASGHTAVVTVENTEKGIGPIVVKTEERFTGGYVFPKAMLSPPGTWRIHVAEQAPPAYDAVADFTVQYPDAIAAAHVSDVSRTFGVFDVVLLVMALIISIGAGLLFLENKKIVRILSQIHAKKYLPSLSLGNLWLVLPLDFLILVTIGLSFGGHNHGNGNFLRSCQLAGGSWHENVPMRDGQATSDAGVLGCMLGSGRGTFHFADPREFAFFTRRTDAFASLLTDPAAIRPGLPATLIFRLQDARKMPVTGLTLEHDRILHAIIVSQDLQTFAHVHMEDDFPLTGRMINTATFPVRYTFPKPGKYLIGIDDTVRAQTFSQLFPVMVGTAPEAPPKTDTALEKTAGGMHVVLSLPSSLKAGIVQRLTYDFAEGNKPVTDLQPYLSAAMHLSVVKTDLKKFMHTHAELPQSLWDSLFSPRDPNARHVHVFLPDRFGPVLVAYVLFPVPGQYEIFGEVNRGGKIVVTTFMVVVR